MYIPLKSRFAHVIVHFTEEYREHVCAKGDYRDVDLVRGFVERISPDIPTFSILPIKNKTHLDKRDIAYIASQNLLPSNHRIRLCYENGISDNAEFFSDTPPTLIDTGEQLDHYLRARGVTHIVFTGYFIDGCVLGHASDFNKRGFHTTVLTDLTNGSNSAKELFLGDDNSWYEPGYINGQINRPLEAVIAAGINISTTPRFLEQILDVPRLIPPTLPPLE